MTFHNSCHVDGCKACNLGDQSDVRVVHSILPTDAKVMIIAEAPGLKENDYGKPLIGPAGQLLNECLKEVGIRRESLALSSIVACRPPSNRKPTIKEIKTCYPFLEQEILLLKPEVIVLLGGVPLKQVLPNAGNITSMRGRWYHHDQYNCEILPTFHPAFILRYMNERPKFVQDLRLLAQFMSSGVTETKEKIRTQYFTIETKEQLDWLAVILEKNTLWSCDTETTGLDPRLAEIFIITFSWEIGVGAIIDTRILQDVDSTYLWAKITEIMENKNRKVFQNGSFDIQCLWTYGISVRNFYADTMYQHYLLDENAGSGHGLEVLAQEFTDLGGYDVALDTYKNQNKISNYKDIPPEVIDKYALCDADVTLRSYYAMLPQIKAQNLEFVHDEIMIPTAKILASVEYEGVSIDVPLLGKVTEKYQNAMEVQLEKIKEIPQIKAFEKDKELEIVQLIKDRWQYSKTLSKRYPVFEDYFNERKQKSSSKFEFKFNVNSHKQLSELLIDRMHLPIVKETKKGGIGVDSEVLEVYARTNKFCANLSEYRTLSHLKSTFLDGITRRLTNENKVHTDYLLHSTVTGRPSSRDPNLNNIPRTGTADDIKDIFCSDMNTEGMRDWLLEADLGQAEFRMWINYAKDEQALRDLRAGIDIHKLIASTAYHKIKLPPGNISYEQFKEFAKDVTKLERQNTKMVIFGLMYGRGAPSIAKQLEITVRQAEVIIDQFFGRYAQARQWLKRTIGIARHERMVTSIFGRRRRLLDINSSDDFKRSEAERQSCNAPIQSSASDLVFLALGRIYRKLWSEGFQSRLVLTVYDSLVFNIPDKEIDVIPNLIYSEMCTHPFESIIVPITAEIKIGTHWGSLVEVDMNKPWNEEWEKAKQEIYKVDKKFAV